MAKGLPKFYAKKFGITKRAWREFRKDKKKTKAFRKKSSSKKKNIKKTVRRVKNRTMAKKKRRRNGFSVSSLFKYLRIGAFVAPALSRLLTTAPNQTKINWILSDYTGYDMSTKKFVGANLMRGWMPFIMTSLVSVGIGKLNGIIRRL